MEKNLDITPVHWPSVISRFLCKLQVLASSGIILPNETITRTWTEYESSKICRYNSVTLSTLNIILSRDYSKYTSYSSRRIVCTKVRVESVCLRRNESRLKWKCFLDRQRGTKSRKEVTTIHFDTGNLNNGWLYHKITGILCGFTWCPTKFSIELAEIKHFLNTSPPKFISSVYVKKHFFCKLSFVNTYFFCCSSLISIVYIAIKLH